MGAGRRRGGGGAPAGPPGRDLALQIAQPALGVGLEIDDQAHGPHEGGAGLDPQPLLPLHAGLGLHHLQQRRAEPEHQVQQPHPPLGAGHGDLGDMGDGL